MKQLRSDGLAFIDHEVIPSLDGNPSGIAAWFICENHRAKEKFDLAASTEALKNKLRNAGFPPAALETIWTGVTSQTEIHAGGGRFYFFR
jgi:hypothetical protein